MRLSTGILILPVFPPILGSLDVWLTDWLMPLCRTRWQKAPWCSYVTFAAFPLNEPWPVNQTASHEMSNVWSIRAANSMTVSKLNKETEKYLSRSSLWHHKGIIFTIYVNTPRSVAGKGQPLLLMLCVNCQVGRAPDGSTFNLAGNQNLTNYTSAAAVINQIKSRRG